MNIIKASLEHLDLLVPLFDGYMVFYKQTSDPARFKAFLKARLEHREAHVFIALDDDGVGMGFTLLYPSFSSVSMARVYTLNDLYVHPDYRRRGIASGLMNAAADFCQREGGIRLHLETGHDNDKAQALYEKEGWIKETNYFYYRQV